MDTLSLLQKYEPVACYTQGELFFPCPIDEYVKRCSLWLRNPSGKERQLVAEGELSPEKLASFKEVPAGHTQYLRFVGEPLRALEFQNWLRSPERPPFHAPGRLARVGLATRIIDSLFDLSLWLRGKVPGGTTAAAEIKYRDMQRADPRSVYYGRVVREGGYTILHYIFFYAMNDWRSSFHGVNDHESDWEQIFIYLSEEKDSEPMPRWVAFASHDFIGDDLRRRWDDPELKKYENHPIVFVGAGSHSSYFLPGEYLMGIEPKYLLPIRNAVKGIRRFWTETLGQGEIKSVDKTVDTLLRVPFIDYSRGDGRSFGPGQQYSWTPILLTEDLGWVEDYRGLWGLEKKDPFGGERAPSGPKYNRDGSVRQTWYDPLGWVGLDKVTPIEMIPSQLKKKIDVLALERDALGSEISQKREELRQMELELESLQRKEYLHKIREAKQKTLVAAQKDLQALYAHYAELIETLLASKSLLQEIESGDWGDPQAHIKHKRIPELPISKETRIAELWAAVSGGLLLFAFAWLLLFSPSQWLYWVLLVAGLFLFVEATLRGWLSNFLITITIILALVTGFILVKDFLKEILIIGLFVLVIKSISENLREVREK